MERTYKIIGGDGKEYGPVPLSLLKTWITEGRVDGEIQVLRSDQTTWGPASALPELGLAGQPGAPAAPPPVQPPPPQPAPAATPAGPPVDQARLVSTVRSGASWFYWIAGLSLINSFLDLFSSGGGFVIGLGITQEFDAWAARLGGASTGLVLMLDLLAAGVFVFFGVFASKRHAWAFAVGMVVYFLDGLIFVHYGLWLSVAFHVFALFCIFAGFAANQRLRALARS